MALTVDERIAKARAAVAAIKDYDQAQVDKLVFEAAKIIYKHAEELAAEAALLQAEITRTQESLKKMQK